MGQPDLFSTGRSSRIPYDESETYKRRHARRLAKNLACQEKVVRWCEAHGLQLQITNDGHHWSFYCHGKQLADWWPSSAKFIVNKQWDRSIHVHDWVQLCDQLHKLLKGD